MYSYINTTLSWLLQIYSNSQNRVALSAANSFLFSKVVLATLYFHMYFIIYLIIYTKKKKLCWNFDQDCIESVDQYGENDSLHMNVVYLSIYLAL